MSEESRLGREQIETAWALKQITDARVRVFFYLEDRERTLGSAMDKVMLSLANFASETERERGRLRTRDAMHRKAARGHVAGGTVYGYRNTRRGDHVERTPEPAEASIIKRIFDEVARGRGFAKIARGLNAEGIRSPRSGRGWAMTGVRAIVFRELYRGRLVYGQTQWVDRAGTKVKERRPASECLVVDVPELRLVAEELWEAAHARLERTRQTYNTPSRRRAPEPASRAGTC